MRKPDIAARHIFCFCALLLGMNLMAVCPDLIMLYLAIETGVDSAFFMCF